MSSIEVCQYVNYLLLHTWLDNHNISTMLMIIMARLEPPGLPDLVAFAAARCESYATNIGMYIYIYICIYVYTHINACMCVCVWVCMYVCMHACMYVCMHACMHVCMCACMHANVCKSTRTPTSLYVCQCTVP